MNREELLASVHSFLKRHGMSRTRFGVLAANDHGFVLRLEKGLVNPRLDRLNAILDFMKREDGVRQEAAI